MFLLFLLLFELKASYMIFLKICNSSVQKKLLQAQHAECVFFELRRESHDQRKLKRKECFVGWFAGDPGSFVPWEGKQWSDDSSGKIRRGFSELN